jgi:pimeloyl-ACP methyl ester carboxylesterase
VARHLHAAGHHVIAIDQRGHGLSEKPDHGYDFDSITDDLAHLLDALHIDQPILAGQSWGGNVVLAFGARFPTRARGLVFVDGGTIDMQARPNATWENISTELRPPDMDGTPRATIKQYIQTAHPDWTEEGVENTLANLETLPDETVRRRLSIDNHMKILRALYEMRPGTLYPLVQVPVLICPAHAGSEPEVRKSTSVSTAQRGLSHPTVHWFPHSDHDVHVQRPTELANAMLAWLGQLA